MDFLFGKAPSEKQVAVAKHPKTPPAIILIIDAGKCAAKWADIFDGVKLADGRSCEVVQAGWDALMVSSEPQAYSPTSQLLVHIQMSAASAHAPARSGQVRTVGPSLRTISPAAVLIRNVVYAPDADHRNQLYGLMMGTRLPPSCCVNSLLSIHCFAEKAVVCAELQRLRAVHGADNFPVIAQSYFSSYREMMYTSTFPCVVKIGSAHAGVGKMIIRDHHEMEDFRSVLAMCEGKYCFAEPFLEGEYDLRIQRVGDVVRAFRRRSVSGNWKTNTGSSMIETIEVTPEYQRWADIARTMFGGLHILTVDAIHDRRTGKEYILEVNDTSSGLAPEFEDEDNYHIRDLVLKGLNEATSAGLGPLSGLSPFPTATSAGAAAAARPTDPVDQTDESDP